MADDVAELAFEGVSAGVNNYDNIMDKTKNSLAKIRRRGQDQGQDSESDQGQDEKSPRGDQRRIYRPDRSDDEHVEYDRPRRSKTERSRSRRYHRDGHGEGYVEETYVRRTGRAKSAGRDGRGLDRDGRRRSWTSLVPYQSTAVLMAFATDAWSRSSTRIVGIRIVSVTISQTSEIAG